MKELKLYNVIFPIWFILFFPPVILLSLAGNYIFHPTMDIFAADKIVLPGVLTEYLAKQ